MDPIAIGYLSAGLLVAALLAGVPVAAAMGLIGIGGMLLGAGTSFTISQLRSLPYAVVNTYDFAVLPMFVLMGVMAEASGITGQLFHALDLWLRRVRDGLYQAVVLGSAVFAAVSGSTIVNAVVFTRIAFPAMVKYGYNRSLSIGCIAASGSFAAMIPPSITMVIYAIMTDQSVGRLLIAGIVPGLLTAFVYFAGLWLMVRVRPSLAPQESRSIENMNRATREHRWKATIAVWPLLLLIGPVMGGLYSGLYPASAAGAVGAFLAFCVAVAKRRGTRPWLSPVLPVVVALGIDPIWFGIVLVKLIEISVITPPVGVNLFAVLGAADKDTNVADVLRGVTPFIILEIIVLTILVAVPELSTWLPNQMIK